jgi:hypothetical protein
MTNLRKFLQLFEGAGFDEDELKIFYRSVRKSVILSFFEKRALREMSELEDKCQWPLLQRIDDPALPLYQNVEKTLLDSFIGSIRAEGTLRAEKGGMEDGAYWKALREILEGRIGMYKAIFDYCHKDVKRCELVAERYKRSRKRRIDDSKKLWKYGIGAGASALAGAAAMWYLARKDAGAHS